MKLVGKLAEVLHLNLHVKKKTLEKQALASQFCRVRGTCKEASERKDVEGA